MQSLDKALSMTSNLNSNPLEKKTFHSFLQLEHCAYPSDKSLSLARIKPMPGVTSPIPIENPRFTKKDGKNTNL